jgi:hypothetical protein
MRWHRGRANFFQLAMGAGTIDAVLAPLFQMPSEQLGTTASDGVGLDGPLLV